MAENYEAEDRTEDAAFIERIAASLRAPEHAQPSFEERLMEQVRSEGSALYPGLGSSDVSWWRRKRVIRLSPLTGMAMAAGISAIIALSGIAIGSRIGAPSRN